MRKPFFVNVVFWFFAVPNGSFGFVLVRFGRIRFQNGFQNGSQNLFKMLSKFVKKLSNKGGLEGSKMGCRKLPNRDRRAKAIPTIDQIFKKFFFSFSLGVGALWVPLGSLLGSLEALLGGLWTQKRVKTTCFLMVLKRLFLGLWSSWWLSWAHLVASWANLVSRWGAKMGN